jgi:hypothetical protein
MAKKLPDWEAVSYALVDRAGETGTCHVMSVQSPNATQPRQINIAYYAVP